MLTGVRLRHTLVLLAVLAMIALGVVPAYSIGAGPCADLQVMSAVRSAIETRLGQRVDVTVDALSCALTTATPQALAATPAPMARTGGPVRFVITTVGAGARGSAIRLGVATAVVRVSGEHVRAARLLLPGRVLTAEDLEITTGPFEGLAIRRMPTLAELLGARLVRGVAAGQPIAVDAVSIPPTVRSGDPVRLTVRHGSVEATVMAVAEQSAGLGQVIRVVNASSHRAIRARVSAPGEVEAVE